ncbi:major facilitator superfamily domain-containing protein [Aspergillus taichungensis]|uniref:Major facilitator superfamily domain-containing protein n=1 Tax=Aspergillus taichungensis TaxID=482145 RepID=A0A2J5I6R3_9EURO|nr:major facilitator superfamily domain-containing protein [Aspergillus taichungensis]
MDSHCLSGLELYSVLSGIMSATMLISLDVSIISTAIPAISTQFNAATDIGWYGAAYPLTMCALQPLSGKISTIFSLRSSYLVFFGIFLLGSVLCGASTSSAMFIVGRAIAGIGGAGIVSGGLSVIALVTPTAQRPLFTGLVASLYAVGTVIAPIIGGAFTTHVSWRWCFYINLPAGAVTIVTLLLFFRPPTSTAIAQRENMIQRIMELDLIGCVLFVGSIVMFFLALQWGGGEYPWTSATVIGMLAGFAISMLIFIVWQIYRGNSALIPITLLTDRSILLSLIFAFLFMGSFAIPVYYLPEWFQIVERASPIRSGVMLLPSVCTQVFGAIVSGVTAKHVRYYNPWFFVGSSMLCIASGLYTTFSPASVSASKWVGFQILQGLGCGFAAQMALLTVQNVLKARPSIIPVGISTVLFAQYFGSSVMQTMGSSIFHNKLVQGLESASGPRLDASGVTLLLDAGTLNVRETALRAFPDRVESIISAYNDAITTVFYLAVAASGMAFVLSAGLRWTNINQASGVPTPGDDELKP